MTTTNTALSQFIVRDDTGNYDNEYNNQRMSQERAVAIQEAAGQAISFTMQKVLATAKYIGCGVLEMVEQLVETSK